MSPAPAATDPGPGEPPPRASRPTRRQVLMTGWALAFVGTIALIGIPTDPIYLLAWLWAATIAWNSQLPWREHLRFGRDWAPIVGLLIAYNVSRGLAKNGTTPHVSVLIDADRRLFGWATDGQPPTVWLQAHLYDPGAVHWWDLIVSAVYFSHFLTAPTIAVLLWARNRHLWTAFMRRWILLFSAGLATYFLYPAAPPWWAALHGLTSPVARISTRGWADIGLHGAGDLLNAAQVDVANPIAAMPSLHTAFAALCVGFFLPRVRPRWRPVLPCYPAAMIFTLVYSGEHWVVDTLVGIAYAVVVLTACTVGERWMARRPDAKTAAADDPAP